MDLSRQHAALRPQLQSLYDHLLESGQFILGPLVAEFEQKLAKFCNCNYAVGISSGTDALLMAMIALGIGDGDEVITTPFTFFATAGCIARLGAKPVFVDIHPTTFNIDADGIESAITEKTKAIIPVHLFGQPSDMTSIMAIARRHGLRVIEDAAQAMGAKHHSQNAGTFGDIGCLSFYPTKILAAIGDAGACLTNDANLQKKMLDLRVHGSGGRETFNQIGGNFRLDTIQAAILTFKISFLNGWIEQRRALADRYNQKLQCPALGLPIEPAHSYHSYNQYTIHVFGQMRDKLQHHLSVHEIGNRVYYPKPLHHQPCFKHLGYQPGQFPVAEQAAREVLSLPMYPELNETEQDQIIGVVQEFFALD